MADSNKPAEGVSGQRAGADLRSAGNSRETVLLSDLPDAAPPPNDTISGTIRSSSPAPSLASRSGFDLAPNVLAALGQRYEILAEAGHGSMGNVYKARDRETGETVALKLLKPEIASDQAMMDRFKNELLFARKITHKNVCRVYEFNRVGSVAYTSMEFVEGESLRSVLNRFGALSQKKATDLALQICSGLKEAHAQGIVHRDLKPENVMIDGSGNLKLMDFGIARSMEAVTRQTGAMVGTPAYMAPEQVSGSPIDYRTDIYSLGLMLYEMYTGKPAFSAENAIAVALKQMREEAPRPSEVEPSVPMAVERAILKCLEKTPAKRFQTVAALESALRAHAEAGTNPRPTAPPIAAPVPSRAQNAAPPPGVVPIRAFVSSPRVKPRSTSTALWSVLATLMVVSCAAGAWYYSSALDSAANIPGPAPLPAPVPPIFAYEIPVVPASVAIAPAVTRESSNSAPPKAPAPVAKLAEPQTKPAHRDVFPRMETGPEQRKLPDPSKWIAAQKALAKQDKQSKQASQAKQQTQTKQAATSKKGDFIYLRTGIFLREDKAQEAAKKIRDLGLPAIVKAWPVAAGDVWLALCGPIATGGEKAVRDQLKENGFKGVEKVSTETAQ
jgi:serine/threonine protein kinase